MMEFKVQVIEELSKVIVVEAENEQEAIEQVVNAYYSGEIEMDHSDHYDTNFNVIEGSTNEQ